MVANRIPIQQYKKGLSTQPHLKKCSDWVNKSKARCTMPLTKYISSNANGGLKFDKEACHYSWPVVSVIIIIKKIILIDT